MSRRENMLIVLMVNAKLQKHRILYNKHPTFCGCAKKEQSVEKEKKTDLMSCRAHTSRVLKMHIHTHPFFLCRCFSLTVCMFAWLIPPEGKNSFPTARPTGYAFSA